MQNRTIHTGDDINCQDNHGPFFYLKNVPTHNYSSKIKIQCICLKCSKLATYNMNKEEIKAKCVFQDGNFMTEAGISKVKEFYKIQERYYKLEELALTNEDIVERINYEKSLKK